MVRTTWPSPYSLPSPVMESLGLNNSHFELFLPRELCRQSANDAWADRRERQAFFLSHLSGVGCRWLCTGLQDLSYLKPEGRFVFYTGLLKLPGHSQIPEVSVSLNFAKDWSVRNTHFPSMLSERILSACLSVRSLGYLQPNLAARFGCLFIPIPAAHLTPHFYLSLVCLSQKIYWQTAFVYIIPGVMDNFHCQVDRI